MSVIHYEEVDRTLSLNQFDSPTLSIDSHRTRGWADRNADKQETKWKEIKDLFVALLYVHFL